MRALAEGRVAVVTLAGGVGSRWTKGSGAVKALNPFCKLGGRRVAQAAGGAMAVAGVVLLVAVH